MGGIEILLATTMFVLGTIGLIRGPAKELGVTMALVVLLAVFAQFDALVDFGELPARVNNIVSGVSLGSEDLIQQQMMVVFLYGSAVVVTAFLAYHGQDTLAFQFEDPPGAGGVILGWLAGALNGYLIFGAIWFYLDRFGYPIRQYSWFQLPLTELGRGLVNLLPQNLAGGLIWSGLALALLWWRILR